MVPAYIVPAGSNVSLERSLKLNRLQDEVKTQPAWAGVIQNMVAPGQYVVVIPDIAEVLQGIAERGRFFGPPVKVTKTAPQNGCHTGAARLYMKDRKRYRIATGFYAVEDDPGVWRRHSWCVDAVSLQPIETTDNAVVAYYGVILTKEGSGYFAEAMKPKPKQTKAA